MNKIIYYNYFWKISIIDYPQVFYLQSSFGLHAVRSMKKSTDVFVFGV